MSLQLYLYKLHILWPSGLKVSSRLYFEELQSLRPAGLKVCNFFYEELQILPPSGPAMSLELTLASDAFQGTKSSNSTFL
jgi:hypothetical protein